MITSEWKRSYLELFFSKETFISTIIGSFPISFLFLKIEPQANDTASRAWHEFLMKNLFNWKVIFVNYQCISVRMLNKIIMMAATWSDIFHSGKTLISYWVSGGKLLRKTIELKSKMTFKYWNGKSKKKTASEMEFTEMKGMRTFTVCFPVQISKAYFI